MAGVSAAWLALHCVFFPPSCLQLSFFQSLGSCTCISPVFPVRSERIQPFQALVLHETVQQKHKSSSFFLFFPPTTGASAYLVRVVPCWFVESLQTVAMPITISLCISYLTLSCASSCISMSWMSCTEWTLWPWDFARSIYFSCCLSVVLVACTNTCNVAY